jgi:hypothetical protein
MLDLVEQDDAEIGCASIPQGATTCAFCLSMAAVGFAKSFEVLEEEGRTFHDHCDCRFIPGPIGQSVKLSDYNSDAVQNALNDAKRTLGYPTDKKLKPEWERAIRAELERRDSKWVMEGVVPEIDSEPKELLDFIRKDRPHEERTALRLALRGYKSTFAPDTIERFDELKGMMQTIGLADTKQGIEFKTIMVAKEESTIDDYLRKAAKKEGVKLLVFDTYESKYLSDTKIVEFVSNNMRKRGISEVLVIMKDGSLRYIKK